MINTPQRTSQHSASDEPSPLVLTIELPSVEEIAKAIWKRQHEAINPDALSYDTQWRDSSLPSRYWDQFLLDARAVLLLIYNMRVTTAEEGNAARKTIEDTVKRVYDLCRSARWAAAGQVCPQPNVEHGCGQK
jgi:hypothetical protein